MALITCQDLSLGYEGNAILSHLNFVVEKGNYFCIVGENGAGKTTLMKTLLNLQSPLKGTIQFDGLQRNEIGYLPQQLDIMEEEYLKLDAVFGEFVPMLRYE